jgi:hypothetical protein
MLFYVLCKMTFTFQNSIKSVCMCVRERVRQSVCYVYVGSKRVSRERGRRRGKEGKEVK